MKPETAETLRRIAATLAKYNDPGLQFLGDSIVVALNADSGDFGLSSVEADYLRTGAFINAIKEYRARTGASMKDAKEFVEAAGQNMGLWDPVDHWKMNNP